MDFRTELAKWGYNKGNSIDVEILVNEILPSLSSQQERSYSEEDMKKAFNSSSLTNMLDVYDSFEEFIEQFKNK
mgnify:CR=1 FL=1